MRLIDLKPKAGSKHRKRRIGRGIAAGQGASGGFGMRGQKSRSGSPTRPGFEGGQMPLYRRLPKLKHFPLINQKEYTVINVRRLCELPANSDFKVTSLFAGSSHSLRTLITVYSFWLIRGKCLSFGKRR